MKNKRKSPNHGTMVCKMCGNETPKRSAVQKYCLTCSIIADTQRKSQWARTHPSKKNPKQVTARTEAIKQRGQSISETCGSFQVASWMNEGEYVIGNRICVVIPFQYGYSKNHLFKMSIEGHVQFRQETIQLKETLAAEIAEKSKNIVWYQDKVWLDIFVQKPDHRGDAVNVIDHICDAVERGLGVDDRWFSIRKLDWEVVKTDHMLMVRISQNSSEHKKVCSNCGRILAVSRFHKSRYGHFDVGRWCYDCTNTTIPLQDINSRNSS